MFSVAASPRPPPVPVPVWTIAPVSISRDRRAVNRLQQNRTPDAEGPRLIAEWRDRFAVRLARGLLPRWVKLQLDHTREIEQGHRRIREDTDVLTVCLQALVLVDPRAGTDGRFGVVRVTGDAERPRDGNFRGAPCRRARGIGPDVHQQVESAAAVQRVGKLLHPGATARARDVEAVRVERQELGQVRVSQLGQDRDCAPASICAPESTVASTVFSYDP